MILLLILKIKITDLFMNQKGKLTRNLNRLTTDLLYVDIG